MMDVQGKRVILVGLGRSSVAAARLLMRHGAVPFITEQGESRTLEPWKDLCQHYVVPFETGGHSPTAFEQVDMLVLSPGVPAGANCLDAARRQRVPVLGELELASRFCTARTLAVTGTNGKTTVTALVCAMIQSCGHSVALAGNNDTPLSLVVLEEQQPEYVVIEVSSYQLETTDQFHPAIAAVLNITPDHLGRHGTMDNYTAMKARLFNRQGPGDAAIVNMDDARTCSLPLPEGVTRIGFSLAHPGPDLFYADDACMYHGDQVVARCDDNPLPGRHNRANTLAALAMMSAGGFDFEHVIAGLRRFKGVPHRIEYVMTLNGVDYYNDSKSTNVDSLRVALESFDRPIVLIAGGRGKGSDYGPLRPLIQHHVKHLVVFGEDAPLIAAAWDDCTCVTQGNSMMDSVRHASRVATSGDLVLLSPACASFDMYANFEARGLDYKDCLAHLAGAPENPLEIMQ